jgi:transposase
MPMTAPTDNIYIGIDVSKASLDIAVQSLGRHWKIANSAAGVRQWLQAQADVLPTARCVAVAEATGGYERVVLRTLEQAGMQVVRAHPNRVKHFALYQGQRAKTDASDAMLLSRYAATLTEAAVVPLPDARQEALQALRRRRDDLMALLRKEQCRLQQTTEAVVRTSIEALLTVLREQIHAMDQQLRTLIEADATLSQRAKLLQSLKGVGPGTAHALIALLPELGQLSNNKIVALVGLAPYNRDSGQKSGKRFIGGGRAALRAALYMAARSAASHNVVLKPFFDKLIQAHKPYQLAMTAVMRKLLVILNGIAKSHQKWKFAP